MLMKFTCEKCGKQYQRETYNAQSPKYVKDYWRSRPDIFGLCPVCYFQGKQDEWRTDNVQATIKTEELGLPELQGTEKQIVWANKIRLDIMSKMEQYIGLSRKRRKPELMVLQGYMLGQIKNAKWYIESRNSTMQELFYKLNQMRGG